MMGLPDDYPTKKQKIMALGRHDASVLAVMRMADFNGIAYEEMLELLVLQLAAEKKALQETNQTLYETRTQPLLLPSPKGRS